MSETIARKNAPPPIERKNAGGVTETTELKKLSDDLKTTFEQFKEHDQAREAEIKKLGGETAETKGLLAKIQSALDSVEVKMQRALTAARGEDTKDGETAEMKARQAAEIKYLRKGEAKLTDAERKSLASDDNTDGGYLVNPVRSDRIIQKLIQFSPVRELANVVTIGTGNTFDQPAEDSTDFAGGWVGERETRANTTTGKIRMEKIPTHEIYAQPPITRTLLEDASYDVEAWADARVATRFAVMEGTAFVSGDMDGKPEGLLTNSSVTAVNSGNGTLLTADGLIDLVTDLPEQYARNATFLFKRSTLGAIRKLKDSQNRYLWEPGLNGSIAPSLLGSPYREAIDMPAVGAGLYPILYGDFRATYTIVDRRGITMIRDELTSKPFILLYHTKRVGGQVVLAEAMRKQLISA